MLDLLVEQILSQLVRFCRFTMESYWPERSAFQSVGVWAVDWQWLVAAISVIIFCPPISLLSTFLIEGVLESQKLRDVLQERESTIVNYFKVSFHYIEHFSCSISVYLTLSRFILVYLGLSQSIMVYLGLSQYISVYLGLSQSISVYLGLSRTVSDYLGLSRNISD